MGGRLLYLTTPELRGADVLEVQKLLRAHGFKPGPLDAVYGPATAAAVRRAQRHYRLRVDGVVGPETREALAGKPHAAPVAHPGREPVGVLAMKWMLAREGMHDGRPARKWRCPITEEFGLVGPWCMETVSLAFKHGANFILGDTIPHPWGFWGGRGFAYVPAFEAWAKTRGFWIGRTTPAPGDVPCYGFGGSLAEHTGIVVKSLGGGVFEAIEGNTSDASHADGGALELKRRYVSDVIGFARVTVRQP